MQRGQIVAAKDAPERTERLLAALTAQGITPESPGDYGLQPIHSVHTEPYVEFLATIWERWIELPDYGPEVWPCYFPYISGAFSEAKRPPLLADAIEAQIGWYLGDMSAPLGPSTFLSALRSAETAVAAADALVSGERLAYALCRPSGHHARADRAAGLCFLNNAAIAAERLKGDFDRLAVLDIDVHHGDGTQQIFYRRDDVLTVSIHADPTQAYPFFTGYTEESGHGRGDGFNLNLPLPKGAQYAAFESALLQALDRIAGFRARVLLLSLGFDGHALDPVQHMKLATPDYEAIGKRIKALGIPTLVIQEGGYALDAIGGCLEAFLTGVRA